MCLSVCCWFVWQTINGPHWCVSNHSVCLSERFGYLWCTFVRVPYTANALKSGQEARIVHIDFSWSLNRVNHQGIPYKLCSVGIGAPVLSILTQFLSYRSQNVIVASCRSKLTNVVSGAVFWAPYCLSCTPWSFFPILENKLSLFLSQFLLRLLVYPM